MTLVGNELESISLLGIGVAATVVAAGVLSRFFESAKDQAVIWRTALGGVLLLCLMELTGSTRGLMQVVAHQPIVHKPPADAFTFHDPAGDAGRVAAPLENVARRLKRNSATKNDNSRDGTDIDVSQPKEPTAQVTGSRNRNATSEREGLVTAGAALPNPKLPRITAAESLSSARESISPSPYTTPPALDGGSILSIAWLIGTVAFLLRCFWNNLRVLMMQVVLQPLNDDEMARRVVAIKAQLGMRRLVRLMWHEGIQAPIAFGVFRPTIVLPHGFQKRFDREHQDAVLAHELMHLASFDTVWRQLSDVVTAIVWWHPGAWIARRRLSTCLELAADEASLLLPQGPGNLADCLVQVGRELIGKPRFGLIGIEGRGSPSALAHRVRRLLRLSSECARMSHRGRTPVGVCLLFLVLLSSILPSALAGTGHIFQHGETTMQVMKKSWQSSIAAALVTAVMAPTASWAQIAEADVEQEVEIEFAISEDDGEVRRKIRLLRAREDELEERRERERGPRPRIRIRREIRIETDQPRQVRRQALENARKEIRAQLNKLRFGRLGDVSDRLHEELQRIERNLEELHEHEDERHFVAREHRQQDPQAVQRRLQHIHAAIENLRAAGMHERAEQLQQEARKEWNFQNQWWKNPIVEQHVLRAEHPVGKIATRLRNVASPSQHREILRLCRDMDQMRNQMHEMQALLHRLLDRGDSSLNLDRDHDDEGHYRGHDEAEDHDDDPFGDH